MMYWLQSWKDSLSLFKPKDFKLFALATFKTIGQTYWLLLKYFWWVQLGMIGLFIWFPQSNLRVPVESLVLCIWVAIIAVCVRPSVAKKDYAYFSKYFFYLPVIIVLFKLIEVLGIVLSGSLHDSFGLIFLACIVVQLLFMFFMFDMFLGFKNEFKSFLFAFKMFWYNVPALFLIIGTMFVLFILRIQILKQLVESGWLRGYGQLLSNFFKCMYFFDYLIVIPIIVSIIGNFYIKRLHEQPQLYFKQPKEQE